MPAFAQKGLRRHNRPDAAALDRAAAIASWPAVKFRVEPECSRRSTSAMLRSAPPTEQPAAAARHGETVGAAVRIARESSRLPTSARPKVRLAAGRVGHAERRRTARSRSRMSRAPSAREDMNAEIVARPSQGRDRGTESPRYAESPVRGPAGPLRGRAAAWPRRSAPAGASATAAEAPVRRRRSH